MAAVQPGSSAGGTTTEDRRQAFDFSASHFATIVTTTTYVDKSLMIRDFYNAPSKTIMITAPPRFGKSINLDMVKRFFEIEIDPYGDLMPVETSNNYRLFKDYNLEICKDMHFVNKHFGKRPVVYIDLKPLSVVGNFVKLFDAYEMILKNSYSQHRYILQNSRYKQEFSKVPGFTYLPESSNEYSVAAYIRDLCYILNRFFERKVFVLIDSFDAFFDSPFSINNEDINSMMSFVGKVIGKMVNEDHVERVLITGVIPIFFTGGISYKIRFYNFLDSHPFTKYYGLTSSEVDAVLSKVIESEEERDNTRNTINDYYNAYDTCTGDIRVYNIFSVLQYICQRTVQRYWCDLININKFRKCFKDVEFIESLRSCLLGVNLTLDVSEQLWHNTILNANSAITSGKFEKLSRKKFFLLLYHFGYFSVSQVFNSGFVYANITNEEIKWELAKVVFEENRNLYSSQNMDGICWVLNAFQPGASDLDQNFKLLFSCTKNFCVNDFCKTTGFVECLFMNLVTGRKYSRVTVTKFNPDNQPKTVLLKNSHNVVVCITYDRDELPQALHLEVTDNIDNFSWLSQNAQNSGCVIIAIGCDGIITYSYCLKRGDNLREIKFLQ